jgi:hypothetical protein
MRATKIAATQRGPTSEIHLGFRLFDVVEMPILSLKLGLNTWAGVDNATHT